MDYAKPRVREKSYEKYEGCLRLHIKPRLGTVRLAALREPDITRTFNDLLDSGADRVDKAGNHPGLTPVTVKNTRRYLIMCLDQAVRSGLMTRNTAKETKNQSCISATAKNNGYLCNEGHTADHADQKSCQKTDRCPAHK